MTSRRTLFPRRIMSHILPFWITLLVCELLAWKGRKGVSAWSSYRLRNTPRSSRELLLNDPNHDQNCNLPFRNSRALYKNWNGIHHRLRAHNENHPGGVDPPLLGGGILSTSSRDTRVLLDRMVRYFESMIDPETGRFFLLSYPQTSSSPDWQISRESGYANAHCPMRDLGSAWDATTALKIQRYYSNDCIGGDDDGVEREQVASSHTSQEFGLEDAILRTTRHYSSSLVSFWDGGKAQHLSPEVLGETPTIAHNALLLLALVGSNDLRLGSGEEEEHRASTTRDGLARGILCRQRTDGAFRTDFATPQSHRNDCDTNHDDASIYRGIEFIPGEAMTALMEVYLRSGRVGPQIPPGSSGTEDPSFPRVANPHSADFVTEETLDQIFPAMSRALLFYRNYYEEGRAQNTLDVNYSIWQVQAFARLVFAVKNHQEHQHPPPAGMDLEHLAEEASCYCLDLCRDILRSPAWKLLSRGRSFYPNLSTIEIACGLDALSQGMLVLLQRQTISSDKSGDMHGDNRNQTVDPDDDGLQYSLAKHIDEGVSFLQWMQDRISSDCVVGYGGLGHGGYCVTEQRLDVTGHALSAVAKLVLAVDPKGEEGQRMA